MIPSWPSMHLHSTTPINVLYMCIIPVKIADYSRIMPHAFTDWLFQKLCQHIRLIPIHDASTINTANIMQTCYIVWGSLRLPQLHASTILRNTLEIYVLYCKWQQTRHNAHKYIYSRSLTLKGPPSKVISISPWNSPSSRSSLYLLLGPCVGNWVISGMEWEREARREAGSEGGKVQVRKGRREGYNL